MKRVLFPFFHAYENVFRKQNALSFRPSRVVLLITLISALIELEYLVHQIDNGYDFEQFNGFEIVLGIIDSGLDNNLVKKSARVISAATQANSKGLNSSENSEKFIFLYF